MISWSDDIKNLINSWIDLTRASSVRAILDLFKRAIENEIGGGISMKEEESIVEAIGENNDSIKAAWAIADALPMYKSKTLLEFVCIMEKEAKQKGFIFEPSVDFNKTYSGFSFSRESWELIRIRFEFQSRNMTNLIVGIVSNADCRKNSKYSDVKDFIKAQTERMEHSNIWPCYEYVDNEYKNWNNSNIYIDMHRNKEADLIKYIFKKIDEFEPIAQKANEYFRLNA